MVENLGWGPVAQGLMGPLVVVKTEVGVEAGSGLPSVRVGFQVDLLVLHRAPQPLHKEIIRVPPLPVHADLDSVLLQEAGERLAGKLAHWSVLKISGLSRPSATSNASREIDLTVDRG
jgi:hypothetical protein